MHQQHVIDWWISRGYQVTVLSDWSLMCITSNAIAQSDPDGMRDAMQRRHAAKWAVK